MERYKLIIKMGGKKIEFLSSLSENEAIDEATRYVDLVLSHTNEISYLRKEQAIKITPDLWDEWFFEDGYYTTLNVLFPQLILSDSEIKKGLDNFSHESLMHVFIEKEGT